MARVLLAVIGQKINLITKVMTMMDNAQLLTFKDFKNPR